MLSEGLGIELSHIAAENTTLKHDYLWQVVEIVIGGIKTVLEVGLRSMFLSLCRILVQVSVSKSLFDPMRYKGDFGKVEVAI
jgi:hypothetical protein